MNKRTARWYTSRVTAYSLYLHIPFCRHRCAYCDFNTYAGIEDLIPRYTEALAREMRLVAEAAGTRLPVDTVFFGGGTPSLLPVEQLGRLLETTARQFNLAPGAEITLEANPGTVSLPYLREIRDLGVNRLSLGVQSAVARDLRVLERAHDFQTVIRAVHHARKAGFDNLSLDLIFGVPYQAMADWQFTMEACLRLSPEHFSVYSLILEHGTPMNRWVERGLLSAPNQDLAADMYEWSMARLEETGYSQYEISNFARQDGGGAVLVCRHNMQYWYNQPYLGLGAGAHGFAGGVRTANVRGPQAYIERCLTREARSFPRSPAAVNAQPVDRYTEMQETMLVGLRLTQEGVSESRFQARFGVSIGEVFGEEIEDLRRQGLAAWVGDGEKRLRLTAKGKLLGNQVFMKFV